jgi:hypothetical protein
VLVIRHAISRSPSAHVSALGWRKVISNSDLLVRHADVVGERLAPALLLRGLGQRLVPGNSPSGSCGSA